LESAVYETLIFSLNLVGALAGLPHAGTVHRVAIAGCVALLAADLITASNGGRRLDERGARPRATDANRTVADGRSPVAPNIDDSG
jgi:hypothetical protein